MMREAVNRLRGQVHIRVESDFPERMLNLCGARGLAFWDVVWESSTSFTCRLSRQDYRILRRSEERLGCTLTVLRREGAPYFFARFRRRPVLAVAAVVCGMALVLGSFFIWEFTVEGNETVPTERILRSLEKNGVGLGAFGLTIDGEDLRNHVLLDIPELSWIAVNVSGCRAVVQVRERKEAPELLDERDPTNIVARRAGLVLELQDLNGNACVLEGTSVTEGQLLISGVEDTGTFGARLMAGIGTVRARTWYSLTAAMPLTVEEKQYTGDTKTAVSLVFGTHRIKFFSNGSIAQAEYDKIINRYPCTLLGIPLPVTLVAEEYRFYESVSTEQTAFAAEKRAEQILTEYLQELVKPYGVIRSTLCASRQKEDALVVTLTAECEEEIGEAIPILTTHEIQE